MACPGVHRQQHRENRPWFHLFFDIKKSFVRNLEHNITKPQILTLLYDTCNSSAFSNQILWKETTYHGQTIRSDITLKLFFRIKKNFKETVCTYCFTIFNVSLVKCYFKRLLLLLVQLYLTYDKSRAVCVVGSQHECHIFSKWYSLYFENYQRMRFKCYIMFLEKKQIHILTMIAFPSFFPNECHLCKYNMLSKQIKGGKSDCIESTKKALSVQLFQGGAITHVSSGISLI